MAAVDFQHHENPPTWAGVEPVVLNKVAKRPPLGSTVLLLWILPTPLLAYGPRSIDVVVAMSLIHISVASFNGDRYRAMITNFFLPELNNHDVQELWFQQDGAPCHTARATIDLLKDTFGDRLISRFGPANWPPRSCDLTPLDYFLWGYVSMRISHKRLTIWKTAFAVLLPIYGHKCWKKSSKIGRPVWTTSEPAVAVLCQKSYLKCNATRLSFE
ncbi:uncharacterized protein TNCV_711081 [Trichonephila clavipes]|nr:uncharacterized protein TNCV_711081 [Trichonephila clavipes]